MPSVLISDKKYIICLGDGMADEPMSILGDKTPLEAAETPHMDRIAKLGKSGLVHTVPDGLSPGSDVANMGILGYDPRRYYSGRGAIEAAAMGIEAPEGKIIFRLNLVCVEDGIMKDFTAGHISNDDASMIIADLNKAFQSRGIQFFPGVSYRHIALLDEKFLNLKTVAPHDITDKPIDAYIPHGDHDDELRTLMTDVAAHLASDQTNQARVARGERPANYIWPWSQGRIPELPSFYELTGLRGGIVTAVDLLKGLGNLSGLSAPDIPGATGFIDTNYANKVSVGLDMLKAGQFAYIHVEAPDEAGHMGDAKLKIKAIEDFDQFVVGPILDYQAQNPDTVVMVLPDHPTPCHLKTHTNAPVPVAIYTAGMPADESTAYNEVAVTAGDLRFNTPWNLLKHFLSQ